MLSSINSLARWGRLYDGVRCFSISNVKYAADNSDKGDDKKEKAKDKLNLLLQNIINDDSLVKENKDKPPVDAARPRFKEKKEKERSDRNLGEKIVNAADQVAEKMEGDRQKNQAELLSKVVEKNEALKKSVFKAARNSTLSLLLSELNVEKERPQRSSRSTLDDMVKSDRSFSRADLMKTTGFQIPPRKPRLSTTSSIDIFKGKPLGIFSAKTEYIEGPRLEVWKQCAARELKLTFTHPPRNIWQQMILWTEKGMLWKFPIDNEQGLEKEQEVSFVDHIFLDIHLEDWCPKRGPIRQFMDLVVVGLSRNHWLSAEEKKDHIMWYKEYFMSKKELISELGAGDIGKSSQSNAAI